ncbi:MAG: hypothetical protein KatS3mg109_0057 [Pirellulaceae bacterium]|nr:MAG: hypothetical protein KatS3mg109_0057 [Pirellulaceae bacterium]
MIGKIDPLNMTPEDAKAWSAHVVGLLEEGSESSRKEAEMTMNEYIRPFNREMDFCNRILTPTPWDESERVPALDHDHPQLFIEIEPASPGAMMVDFGYQVDTFYPYGQRMPMVIQQQMTERVVKEIIELGGYKYKFRQALTDLASLQLAALRDSRFMNAVNDMLGTANTALPYSGAANHVDFAANIDYPSWLRFLDITMQHPNKLKTASVLVNQLTLKYLRAVIAYTFQGTELAADVWRKSFEEVYLQGDNVKLIATIKDSLVPENHYYGFAAENRLGRYVQYKEPTMVVKNEGLHISFYQYEALGMALVNPTGVSLGKFNNS